MSRCFGFPPPGYSTKCSINGNDNEALILSIKLQRENEKAISDREREKVRSSSDKKEKKREKKERKKHKEKEKSHHAVDGLVKEKQVTNVYEVDKYRAVPENKCSPRHNESEQLEKSSVTEEHGQPIDLQKASCSSDSTGNSSKRKRTSTPPSSIQSHGNGNILRIRLSSLKTEDQASTSGRDGQGTSVPLSKREEHKTISFRNFQPCSSILREVPSVKRKDVKLPLDNNKKLSLATTISGATLHPVSRQDQKLLRLSAPPLAVAPASVVALVQERALTSAPVPLPVPAAAPAPKEEKLSSHEKKILKRDLKYKELFGSWVPPSIQHELVMDDESDEDWLFGNKGDEKPSKRLKRNDSDMNGESPVPCASAALQPRASYLSDVDIYAMPFTVPF